MTQVSYLDGTYVQYTVNYLESCNAIENTELIQNLLVVFCACWR
jgi:hypothetical protein